MIKIFDSQGYAYIGDSVCSKEVDVWILGFGGLKSLKKVLNQNSISIDLGNVNDLTWGRRMDMYHIKLIPETQNFPQEKP